MDILIYDIETIPTKEKLNKAQENFLIKKLKRYFPDGKPEAFLFKKENPKYLEYKNTVRMLMATSPYLGDIVCIGMMHVNIGQFEKKEIKNKFSFIGNEEIIIKNFWQWIKNRDLLFVSYNGLGFDVPFILKKSMKYGIRCTNNSFLYTARFKRRPHFDVMQVLADWDRLETVSLGLACETFGIPTPKDGAISAETVQKAFDEGNIKGIQEYCLKDIDATYNLFKLVSLYQPKS